eukprot:2723108-Alexandrium_andersonii.AAC.1
MAKRYSNDVCNTREFEKTILGEATCHHLASLAADDTFCLEACLVNPWPAGPQLQRLLAAELGFDPGACRTAASAR